MSNVFPPSQPSQAALGNVEVYLDYGGDFQQQSNGDVVLAGDLPGAPTATTQRIQRLLYTNPRIQDAFGNYITSGDDIFHPDWPVGLPSKVGKMFPGGKSSNTGQLPSLLAEIEAAAQRGLASDPSIARNPAPTAVVAPDTNPNQLDVNIVCQAVTGEIITVPSRPITGGS